MGEEYKNFCKNVFFEIYQNELLQKVRRQWKILQGRCSCQKNAPKIESCAKSYIRKSASWISDCEKSESDCWQIFTTNKITVEITKDITTDMLKEFIRYGICNFGIDLFYGSVHQNLGTLLRLQEIALEESENLNFMIPLSIYLKICPRKCFTGKLKRNKMSIELKTGHKVILTADREYATECCHSKIYINAKFLVSELKSCDIIRIGKSVQVQVQYTDHISIYCNVIVAGPVSNRTPVKFPPKFNWVDCRVSAEELEDVTLAMGANINIIVSSASLNQHQSKHLREVLRQFSCENFYLFAHYKLQELERTVNVDWIFRAFDGFVLNCSAPPPQNQIVKLSEKAKYFLHKVHLYRKPLLLYGKWSVHISRCDYVFAFYYPDKYILPCDTEFLHLSEAVFHRIAPMKCTETNFEDRSTTGSNTLARAISAASFDFQADAIILCTVVGRMAEKIANFRTKAPIIGITEIESTINFTTMHHNVLMLYFERDEKVSHKKDTHQKLVFGIRYAAQRGFVILNSKIILVFRKLQRFGYTDKFAVIRFDEDFEETVKDVILKK